MVEQGINGTQPLFIANEGKSVSLEDDFMRLTRRSTIDQLHDNKEVINFYFFHSALLCLNILEGGFN